jgi:CubicO group peptidase (beta-lactamase class C family)
MKLFALGLAITLCSPLHAAELPFVRPEKVGFSSERLEKISEFTQREIDAGHLVGTVTLVARHGKIVHYAASGRYGLDNDKPMDKDALFRIYSMSKPITTVAMMILYEEGKFELGDPVSQYLPEFAEQKILKNGELVPPGSAMTIEQLMTHTAGLSYGFYADNPVDAAYQKADLQNSRDLRDFTEKLSQLPLRYEPGTRYFYSVATDVLGAMVERLSGVTLEEFFNTRIFGPLEMHDTYFNVPPEKLDRLATNHFWNQDEQEIALMPENASRPPTGITLFSGGGGLISTAMDYLKFCEMLRSGGSYHGARILGPKTVQFMTIDHLTAKIRNEGANEFPASHLYPGDSFAFGLSITTNPGQAPVISSSGELSWGGAANTKFWIDQEEDVVAILMTQVMGSPWSDHTRFQMKIATYQALTRLGNN